MRGVVGMSVVLVAVVLVEKKLGTSEGLGKGAAAVIVIEVEEGEQLLELKSVD